MDGTDRDKELFAAIATGWAVLDMKLKTASRYTKLLKNLMLKVVWRGGMIDLDLVTPDILDVQTGNGPEDMVQVMVTNYGPSERMEDVTYSVWTPETWRKLDYRGGEIDGGPNPYGMIPFVPLFDYAPDFRFLASRLGMTSFRFRRQSTNGLWTSCTSFAFRRSAWATSGAGKARA